MVTPKEVLLRKTKTELERDEQVLKLVTEKWKDIEEKIDRLLMSGQKYIWVNDLHTPINRQLSPLETVSYIYPKVVAVYGDAWDVTVLDDSFPTLLFKTKT